MSLLKSLMKVTAHSRPKVPANQDGRRMGADEQVGSVGIPGSLLIASKFCTFE
jgi:hypothetical protein